jgi:hypothetical protein
MVRTEVSEERIASIFRAGESLREYTEQVAATASPALKMEGSNQVPDIAVKTSNLTGLVLLV